MKNKLNNEMPYTDDKFTGLIFEISAPSEHKTLVDTLQEMVRIQLEIPEEILLTTPNIVLINKEHIRRNIND